MLQRLPARQHGFEPRSLADAPSHSSVPLAHRISRRATAVTIFDNNAQKVGKVFATDAADGDFFGSSIALAGTTVIAGALLADGDEKQDTGAAYVMPMWYLRQ